MTKWAWRPTSAVILVTVLLTATPSAQVRDFEPVTDQMLQHPDPADWLNWRRTLDGWGFSPLDQINTENVFRLQLVWSWQLRPGLSQPTPLVYDGVMYIPSPLGVVQAIDAVTGDRIWEYRKQFDGTPDDTFRSRTRSIAIYSDKIYVSTSDAHIVALDARTGEVVWDHTVADYRLGYRYTSGPIVVNGKIVAGMTGCERYKDGVCFISAHDAHTGDELWRTSTIASPGEPGGDTWSDLPAMFRAGGDAWIPGSYDPQTNLIYWSTAQAKPWARVSRGTDGDALYTNSALALDPDTGALQWYYQFIPGESHDLDEVFESVLIDHDGRRSLFKMGKLGILWELDRATGEFVAAHDIGYQNLVDVDAETGRVTYRPGMIPEAGETLEFCPDARGIRNWMASAYHPDTHALYIPIHPTCTKGVFSEVERREHETGDWYFYVNPAYTGWQSGGSGLLHPASPDHAGHLIAMDITSGEILWRHAMRTRPLAAALTTAGGLVVGADTDRYLYIHDAATGDVLFQTRFPSPVQGFPITYAVDGRQYLAIPVGGGRAPGAPNALYVFALPAE
ncbi:MAG: PQQ-binding-like beta-propeller repeat protein [Vicinamibacterales bacterium]